jgi:hypothetical protein
MRVAVSLSPMQGQRAVEQADGPLVLVLRARGVGGAAVAQGGLAQLAGQLEVARDLGRGRGAAGVGPQLEPARRGAVVAAPGVGVGRLVDDGPQVGVGEAELALARDGRGRHVEQPLALDQPADRGGHGQARVIARGGDLRQGRGHRGRG